MPTARVLEKQPRRNNHRTRAHNKSSSNSNNADQSQFESISSVSSGNSVQTATIIRSNAEYDRIRNQTLMFFLDRLIVSQGEEKGRSLHDLSCLFGSKEFTREMRQIVGASRNGLRKFLESFPALFTIEADRVHLTSLTKLPNTNTNTNNNNNNNNNNQHTLNTTTSSSNLQNTNNQSDSEPADRGAGGRDYKREAVDYFSEKLAQFGHSQVPIRYLFGYRSQASQEVRHVSGRNSHEFRQFLLNHGDKFELIGEENVILKSNWSQVEESSRADESQQLNSLMSLECRLADSNVSMDPYLNKQLATLIGARMRQDKAYELTLADLHARMSPQATYTRQIKSLDDLRMLLRMHPRLFKHDWQQHNLQLSALINDDGDLYRQLAQSKVTLLEPQTSATAMRRFSFDARSSEKQQQQQIEQFSGPTSLLIEKQEHVSGKKCDAKQPNGSSVKCALRADAPPFVPAHIQRSQSSLASPKSAHSMIANEAHQSLRTYLIRASASNKANFNPLKPANQRLVDPNEPPSEQVQCETSLVSQQEQLRARWISVVREASNIVSRIMSCTDAIALDCKGFNLGLNGEISLIQIAFISNDAPESTCPQKLDGASKKPEVCLFDLKTNLELAYLLKPLLESEKIVKIIHDVRNKSNALYNQFDIMLNNVFDTQVANLVIQQQETAKPAYKSRYISIQKLCEIYGDHQLNTYRNLIKSKTRLSSSQPTNTGTLSRSSSNVKANDVNYWLARPLTDSMVYELTMDVYCLIGGVYQRLKATIKPEYEPLFRQLNQECVLARIKPDEIRSVKKERKIDLEVIDLKRKLYSQTTEKLVLSNREIRLLRHIDLTAEVRAKIGHCKKVAKKLERLDMKAAKLLEEENGTNNSDSDNGQDAHQDLDCDIAKSYLLGERQPELDALATMMDELKDKMIQDTSSFLDSFDEDEDEAELAAATASLTLSQQQNSTGLNLHRNFSQNHLLHSHSHSHSHLHHQTSSDNADCCRCNCHRTSSSSASSSSRASSLNHKQQVALSLDKTPNKTDKNTNDDLQEAIKSNICDSASNTTNVNESESPLESASSLVDSAIQCNLTELDKPEEK